MALIQFHLDPSSGVSYYVQLIQQVQQALLFGILKSGDRLPTVREVSAQVALNPNTVLRAYRDLEHHIRKARARGIDDRQLSQLVAHVLRENAEEVVA